MLTFIYFEFTMANFACQLFFENNFENITIAVYQDSPRFLFGA